jgi:ferredoxin-NADP reductase
MKVVKGKLIERIKRTPSIESFRFKIDESLSFEPGQFISVIFDEENLQNKALNKYLSFSSSPTKDYIEVTKRLSDSQFSSKLKSLNAGDAVLFKGPLGSCIFKEEYKKIGFLIGGIGITPVISIIEYVASKALKTDAYLLYSNRNEEEIAFREELDTWAKTHNNIQVCYTVTDCVPQDKTCISGRICKEMLMDKIKDACDRIFFIFGPPQMVEAMKNMCLEAKVGQERIKTEKFIGY